MKLLAGLLCTMAVVVAAQSSEQSTLSMYGDRAFRPDNMTLCIIVDSGDTLTFSNQPWSGSEESNTDYELLDYLPAQNIWVIKETGWEYWVNYLVSGSDGEIHDAVSFPHPSPDGTRLLCFFEDLVAGFTWNGIQIWRVDGGHLVLEFQNLSVPWGPVDAEWIDDGRIEFEKLTFDYVRNRYSSRPGWLELSDDGIWMLDDEADW